MSIVSNQVYDACPWGSSSNSRRMAEKGARHGAIRLAATLHRRDDADVWLAAHLAPLMLTVGCSASHQQKPPIPPEVTPAGVSTRVNIPGDLNVNPAETVVGAAAANRAGPPPPVPAPAGPALQPPSQTTVPPPAIFSLPDAVPFGAPAGPALPPPSPTVVPPVTIFSLSDAITFGLQNNPRLRSSRAAISRAQGQEQIAFSPFLPQIDVLGQYGVVSSTYAPGVPGNEGFILASGDGTRSYAETELALQWTLFDFGRTSGRYGQAVARERITELQLTRAVQTIEFDVSSAYLDLLLARASRRVQEDAVRAPRRSSTTPRPDASAASP